MFTSKKKSALKFSLDPNIEIFLQYFLLLHPHINYHLQNNIPDLFPSSAAYLLFGYKAECVANRLGQVQQIVEQ
jgi:hypothetical protein